MNEYEFGGKSSVVRKVEEDAKAPFFVGIDYAKTVDYQSAESNDDDIVQEDFMSISLNANINKDDYPRYKLNCVVVLETSSSMNDPYNNGVDSKQSVANSIICSIVDGLGEEDKFCLVTFNDSFNIEHPLDDIKSMEDKESVKREILSIESSGGDYDFDEGYNVDLGQLQVHFIDIIEIKCRNCSMHK